MELLEIKNKEDTYARWVQYVNEFEGGASVYDGIEEVLNSFHHQIKQAVVSAKTRAQYQIDMINKGLDQYMEVVVLADDTQKHKPDPEPILLRLEKLKISKEDVIYIGDAWSDYQCCLNAGIDFGYAKWESVSSEGITHPTFIFESPRDMLKLIK